MSNNIRTLLSGAITIVLTTGSAVGQDGVPDSFFIKKSEITLSYTHAPGARELSYYKWNESPRKWKKEVKNKLSELIRLAPTGSPVVTEVMKIDDHLSIPAYLLVPSNSEKRECPMFGAPGVHQSLVDLYFPS